MWSKTQRRESLREKKKKNQLSGTEKGTGDGGEGIKCQKPYELANVVRDPGRQEKTTTPQHGLDIKKKQALRVTVRVTKRTPQNTAHHLSKMMPRTVKYG